MNVLNFIDSPDIKDYLSDIGYGFCTELAFLVYMSRKATLQEKFKAWNEIINTKSDCSMNERLNLEKIQRFKAPEKLYRIIKSNFGLVL